ncbi:MAG: hypothetical protein KBF55_02255, partial [Polaromonas sp.]|nr:hypothetical protein [Polaromonas sp.]
MLLPVLRKPALSLSNHALRGAGLTAFGTDSTGVAALVTASGAGFFLKKLNMKCGFEELNVWNEVCCLESTAIL